MSAVDFAELVAAADETVRKGSGGSDWSGHADAYRARERLAAALSRVQGAQQQCEAQLTDSFHDGVILALQVMHAGGDTGDAHYVELVNCCGLDALVKRATAEDMLELSGLDVYLRDPRVHRAAALARVQGGQP